MARDLDLAVIVRAVDRFTGPMRRIRLQTDRFNEVNRRAGRVARGAAAGFGVAGFAFKKMLDVAADFEDLRTTLETVEGSSEKARASMRWVENFAARTPFELKQVSEAFVRLRTYGMEPTGGLLRTLGDTSAAMGKPLMQAVEAIADAVTGENERLKEFGIRARAEAGGMIRYEYSVDGETRSARALASDRAGIQRTILGILDPRYGGAMDKRSKTFRGVLSNLMDQLTRFSNLVMESGPFQNITKMLSGFLDKINEMAEDGRLQQWAERTGKKITDAFKAIQDVLKTLEPWLWRIFNALSWSADKLGGWGNLALTLTGLYIAKPFISLTGALKGVTSWSGKALRGVQALAAAPALSAAPAAVARPAGVSALAGASGGLFGGAARAAPAAGAAGITARVGMLARLGGILAGIGGAIKVVMAGIAAAAGLLTAPFLAIAALVVSVGLLIYKYWQPIKAFLGGVWDGLMAGLQPVIDALQPVWDVFSETFGGIGDLIGAVIDWLKELLEPVGLSTEEFTSFADAGKAVGKAIAGLITNILDFLAGFIKLPLVVGEAGIRLIAALVGGIESKTTEPAAAVEKSVAKVGELLPSSDARRGPLAHLTGAGAAIVKTMGLGVLRAGPRALQRPLEQTLAAAAAAAPTINNNYSITINQQPGEDSGVLAERVMREIEQRNRVRSRGSLHDEL